MKSTKAAFTMIELIFVIVILGILAAVAIPKLSASRADAYASALIADFKVVVKTIQTQMLANKAQPSMNLLFGANGRHANIVVNSDTSITISDGSNDCVDIDVNATHIIVDNVVMNGSCHRFDPIIEENINVLALKVVK